MKVVINTCFGGFRLSPAAYTEMGMEWDGFGHGFSDYDKRTDPRLVATLEKLGSAVASGALAQLKVVEIPDGVDWEIDDYDGIETVHEVHRSWS